MFSLHRRLAVLTAVAATGCPDAPSYDDFLAIGPTIPGSTSTGEEEPTTGVTAGATVDPSSTSSTGEASTGATNWGETDPPVNDAPVVRLMIDPSLLAKAGPVEIDIVASDDVVAVDLLYRGELEQTLTPANFPYLFAVTSQQQCDGEQAIAVIVRDQEGLMAEDAAELTCSLPVGGSEVTQLQLPGATASLINAVAVLGDGFVAVGVLDDRMVVWRLGPDLQVLPGWPKTIGTWTAIAGLGDLPSSATAVVIDHEQNIIVVGNVVKGGVSHYYVVRLKAAGSNAGEAQGQPNEEAAGVAVADDGVIVVVGRTKTSELPAYDWTVWGHAKLDKSVPWRDTLPLGPGEHPDMPNERSERARAAAALPNGEIVVAGEREYRQLGEVMGLTRSSWQRYASSGERVGALWTSLSDVDIQDAANAVVVLSDGSFAVTGWLRSKPGQAPQLYTRHFAGDGTEQDFRLEPGITAEGQGIAHDREGKLVIAAARTELGQLDAWAFAFGGWSKPPVWSQPPFGEPDGWDSYSSVACTDWGYCLAGGFLTVNKKVVGFLRLHNP